MKMLKNLKKTALGSVAIVAAATFGWMAVSGGQPSEAAVPTEKAAFLAWANQQMQDVQDVYQAAVAATNEDFGGMNAAPLAAALSNPAQVKEDFKEASVLAREDAAVIGKHPLVQSLSDKEQVKEDFADASSVAREDFDKIKNSEFVQNLPDTQQLKSDFADASQEARADLHHVGQAVQNSAPVQAVKNIDESKDVLNTAYGQMVEDSHNPNDNDLVNSFKKSPSQLASDFKDASAVAVEDFQAFKSKYNKVSVEFSELKDATSAGFSMAREDFINAVAAFKANKPYDGGIASE